MNIVMINKMQLGRNIFEGSTSIECGQLKGGKNALLSAIKSDDRLKQYELTKYKLRQWCYLLSF